MNALLDNNGDGRDPMQLSAETLRDNGHPKRSLAQLRSAYARTAAGKPDPGLYPAGMTTYRAVKDVCMGCAGDDARMVRTCIITNCPLWPYRTGRNPHSAKRGVATSPNTLFRRETHGTTGHFAVASPAEVV